MKKYIACLLLVLACGTMYGGKKNKKQTKRVLNQAGNLAYLNLPCFKERQKLAAEWVSDCPLVVEIGGGKNPIASYLPEGTKSICIEPGARRRDDGDAVVVAQLLERWNQELPEHFKDESHTQLRDYQYALVIVGLELHMQQGGWDKLYKLIEGSSKAVIEHSATFKTAKRQAKMIKGHVAKVVTHKHEFDFSTQIARGGYPVNASYRTMFMLEN